MIAVGGKESWQSIFSSAMEAGDDISETSSLHSVGSTAVGTRRGSAKSVKSRKGKAATAAAASGSDRITPVSKLRPKKPIIADSSDSVLDVCKILKDKRGDAALIVGADGGLAGIVSDTDIVRRVVAKHLDHSSLVEGVMTPNPKCVDMSDSAIDALGTMIENHFRHLPVLENGRVVGLLDIAKCLYEAISKLEKMKAKGDAPGGDASANVDAALAASLAGVGGAQAAALAQLLGPLLAKASGASASGGVPSLRTVLSGKKAVVVNVGTNIRDTAIAMASERRAALVLEEDELVGILTFKDVMSRAVAKEVPLELTSVDSLMTSSPEFVSPDIDVLEALQIMHEQRILSLPVVEDSGAVLGCVEVMELMIAVGGRESWQSIFTSAMEAVDCSDTGSMKSCTSTIKVSLHCDSHMFCPPLV